MANIREKVVNNVVLNDAVEQVATNEAEFSVHSCEGALDKGPVLSLVVGDLHVSVVEVGNGD